MSIRFSCTSCKKILKIEDMISEQRKVRCGRCGHVIVLTPDPSSPTGLSTDLPLHRHQAMYTLGEEIQKHQKKIASALGILGILFLAYYFSDSIGFSSRVSVEGDVTMDGVPLEEGEILFRSTASRSGIVAKGEIKNGHFRIEEREGPIMGPNEIEIRSYKRTSEKGFRIMAGGTAVPEEGTPQIVVARFNPPEQGVIGIRSHVIGLNLSVSAE